MFSKTASSLLRSLLIVSALLLSLHSNSPAQATPQGAATPTAPTAPGDLDTTFAGFGTGGIIDVGFEMEGTAVQPDGKIVVVGGQFMTDKLFVSRYLPNGQLDLSFDGNGKAEFPDLFRPTSVAIDNDGRIVVATADRDVFGYLVRLTPSGALDNSFDGDGWAPSGFGAQSTLDAVLVQADGQIVACGYVWDGNDDFAVARYNDSDGSLDDTFDGDGKVTIPFGQEDSCKDIAQQSDGKLMVAGRRHDTDPAHSNDSFALARLNTTGSLDGSFGSGGKLIDLYPFNGYITDIAIQPDGKIIALGVCPLSTTCEVSFMARYNPNGSPDDNSDGDSGFGSGGHLTFSSAKYKRLVLQRDGKIFIAGGVDNVFAIARLLSNGEFDATFGGDGSVSFDSIPFVSSHFPSIGLALQPDGRLLATPDDKLVRVWPDGTLDTGGQQTHAIDAPPAYPSGSTEHGYALAVQSDGKYLVAGEVQAYGNIDADPELELYSDAIVARFNPDGTPDTAFGEDGTTRAPWSGILNSARAIVVQPDGSIVVAGYADSGNPNIDFLVARFDAYGHLDSSFNAPNGHIRINFTGGDDKATALTLGPDGQIVIAGNAWNGSRYAWGVARLNRYGYPDTTFDTDGLAFVDFEGTNEANAVVVRPDGKIIVGGSFNGDFFIQQLLANGAPDPSFGLNGGGYNSVSMGGNDGITAMTLGSNGWLYAAGYGNDEFALAQFTDRGLLPTCPAGQSCKHWPGGQRWVNFPGAVGNVPHALVYRNDGQLVVAGCSNAHMAAIQVSIATATDTPIQFSTDFVGQSDCAYGVQFSGANKDRVFLAGLHAYDSDRNLALARFETTAQGPSFLGYSLFLPVIRR